MTDSSTIPADVPRDIEGKVIMALGKFAYMRLSPEARALYDFEEHSQRYLYFGPPDLGHGNVL